MEDSMLVLLIVGIYAYIGIKIVKAIRANLYQAEEEPEEEAEPETDFDSLTVREKIAETQRVSDAIEAMEALQNDLVECCPEWLLCVRIEWLSRNGTAYQHDVICDGTNTATECLNEIAKRESHDKRVKLSEQCQALSYSVRHTQNNTQNDRYPRGEW